MKNQYFGDVNDYLKYGLIRLLAPEGQGVCVAWMLTDDDGSSDGGKRQYLNSPDWEVHDSELFSRLHQIREVVSSGKQERSVALAAEPGILPYATFFDALLDDDINMRQHWFKELTSFASGCDLLFFDQDNGLETASIPKGKRNSSKYLYFDELADALERFPAVLIYQHFPRVKRESYIGKRVREIWKMTSAEWLVCMSTSHVAFLLMTKHNHTFETGQWREKAKLIETNWSPRIQSVQIHQRS